MHLNPFQSFVKLYILLIPAIFFDCYLLAIIDLDEIVQDFILDTQKIDIPGYPDAFNPSLVKWEEFYLMCFRLRDPLSASTHLIGIILLDEDFKPVSKPSLLSIRYKTQCLPAMTQDPRLINIGEDLYVVFNDMVKMENGKIRRMYIGKLQHDESNFFVDEPQILLQFDGERQNKHEKNWVPFEYNGNLLLSQSINPHHVLSLASEPYACDTFALSCGSFQWEWGELRGGTPALKDGDEYLAFFHSSRDVHTIQAYGKKISHYVMGAYTFKGTPPFNLTRISPEPIVAQTFYEEPHYKTWKPLRAVFPAGFVCDNKYIWVSYGRQDHEAWIIKIDKEGLYNSLVPVRSNFDLYEP